MDFHSIKDLQYLPHINATYEYHECSVAVSVAYFRVNSTGCSGEFHVLQHFQNLKNLILKILKEKLTIFCLMGSSFHEIVSNF